MRKIYSLSIVLVLAAMVGCQKDGDLLGVQSGVDPLFYATFDSGADTRTALDANNDVLWSNGDRISVFAGHAGNQSYILQDGASSKSATFEVDGERVLAGTSLSANVAYYPYDSNVTVSENNGSYILAATFPTTQTYSASGTFGNGASPMVAVTANTSDNHLKFKNVGAIFRLRLKDNSEGNTTITKIVFSAEAALAGDYEVTASNTNSPTVNVTNGSNAILLDCGEGVQLDPTTPADFVVAMLPVENLEELTITMYDNVGKKMVATWNNNHSTIERSKAYTTDEMVYSGNENANTQPAVQAALDAAINSTTTIKLEPGVDYGVLYIRQSANSSVVDITDVGGDAAGNEKYRKIENLTIVGAPGATVDQIAFQVGWLGNSEGASYIDVKNLTVRNVNFSGEATAFNMDSSKGSWLGIDGLTIDNCTMNDENGADRFVFQQISGYKELTNKSTQQVVMTTGVKNLSITGCEVDGVYQFIEAREMENLSITNNTIKNTAMHAILLSHNSGAVNYSGNIAITGNKADGNGDRFVRMAGAGDAQIVINNNTITNFRGEDPDYIKVEGLTANGTIDTKNNTLEVATTLALQAALDFATEGTTINLVPSVNYGVVYMGRPTKYNDTEMYCKTDNHNFTTKNAALFKAHIAENGYHYTPQYTTTIKNLTLNGANGATIAGLVAISGNIHQTPNDYILDRSQHYLLDLHLDNIKFMDVDFVGSVDINTSSDAEKTSTYDGITFEGCSFTTGGIEDVNGPAIHYYSEANDGNIKNINVKGCTFTNCFQGVYVHHVNGITVTDCQFNNTGHNAIAIQSHDGGDAVNLNNVVITGNTFTNIHDRVIRFNKVGADSNITIQGNTSTNSGDENKEVMKATSIESGVTTSISENNWNNGEGIVANEELKDK